MLPMDHSAPPSTCSCGRCRGKEVPPVVLGPDGKNIPDLNRIKTRDVLIIVAVIICATGLAIVHVPSVLVLFGGLALGMFISK